MTRFTFYSDTTELNLNGYVAWIKKGIVGQDELFDVLHYELKFPDYDGRNWNALYDLLRDLSWVGDKSVNLVHYELPGLTTAETRIYLEVLSDSITSWQDDKKQRNEKTPWPEHILHVYFPENDKLAIESIIERSVMDDKQDQSSLCPVCGYDLGFAAWQDDGLGSQEICPSCGIQFGYSDVAGGSLEKRKKIQEAWRLKWIVDGMPWRSFQEPPTDWDPVEQLKRLGIGDPLY